MADLTQEQKTFIVRALAQFLPPSEVVKLVKEEFDNLSVSRQAVRYYNPEQSPDLAEEWREVFKAERERVIAEVKDIGTAHKAVRMRELDALYRRAKSLGATKLAAELLEQMAKEEGGAFTNRKELTGKDGGAIGVEIMPIVTDYRQATATLAPPDEPTEAPTVAPAKSTPRLTPKAAKKARPATKAKPTAKTKPK